VAGRGGFGGANAGFGYARRHGAVSDHQDRQIVRLACAAREIFHRFQHRFLNFIQRQVGLSLQHGA